MHARISSWLSDNTHGIIAGIGVLALIIGLAWTWADAMDLLPSHRPDPEPPPLATPTTYVPPTAPQPMPYAAELDPRASTGAVALSIANSMTRLMESQGLNVRYVAYEQGIELQMGAGTTDLDAMVGADSVLEVLANYRPDTSWRARSCRGTVILYEARYDSWTHRISGH